MIAGSVHRIIISLLFLTFFFCGCGPGNELIPEKNNYGSEDHEVKDISLSKPSHKPFDLSALQQNKASVFVFLSPDCPLCRSYVPVLDSLQKKFSSDSIGFYGVFPGTLYSDEEILNFFVSQKLEMPYFVDDGMVMTSFLKATVTPEVFIVDRNGMVEYGGRIDDRVVELGKKKTLINSHELADALLAICSGKKITISKTEAAGCLIEKK